MKPWRVFLFLLMLVLAIMLSVWQERNTKIAAPPPLSKAQPVGTTDNALPMLMLVYRTEGGNPAELAYAWLITGTPSVFPQSLVFTPLFPFALVTSATWENMQAWQSPLRASPNSLQPDTAVVDKFARTLGLPSIRLYITLRVRDIDDFIDTLGVMPRNTSLDAMLRGLPPEEQKRRDEALIHSMCGAYSSTSPARRERIRETIIARTFLWGDTPPDTMSHLDRLLNSPNLFCSLAGITP